MMGNVLLIGFAAAGKTTVGRLLADKLGMRFVDTDELIERETGLSVSRIFDELGEARFRETESAVLQSLCGAENSVIACGGGSVLSDVFGDLAATGRTVWLCAEAETVRVRLSFGRPLFDGKSVESLRAVMERRAPLYKRYADFSIATDGLTPDETAARLSALLLS